MTARQQVMEIVKDLPADVGFEDIMAEVVFLAKIERGSRQLGGGEGVDHAKVEKRFQKRRV
jgi:hypothetical protein